MREAEVVPLPTPEGQEAVRQHQRTFFKSVISERSVQLCLGVLRRSGHYTVQVLFRASKPDYECKAAVTFRLSNEQAERIRNNATVLLFQNVPGSSI